jgi:hypothetical protein
MAVSLQGVGEFGAAAIVDKSSAFFKSSAEAIGGRQVTPSQTHAFTFPVAGLASGAGSAGHRG